MAKHTVEQKNIVENIKGQLMAGAIGALILLILWAGAFNRYPLQPEDLTNWSYFALFAILPASLLLLLAPLHAKRIKFLSLPDEERVRFAIFVLRYTHISRLLFLWVCFAALPALILRWFDAPLPLFLAAIVALLFGIGSVLELRAYYRTVEAYYNVLPPDLLQEEIEEAKKRENGASALGVIIAMLVQMAHEYWTYHEPLGYTQIEPPIWNDWSMIATFFIIVLAIVNELLFKFFLRRWIKRVQGDSA